MVCGLKWKIIQQACHSCRLQSGDIVFLTESCCKRASSFFLMVVKVLFGLFIVAYVYCIFIQHKSLRFFNSYGPSHCQRNLCMLAVGNSSNRYAIWNKFIPWRSFIILEPHNNKSWQVWRFSIVSIDNFFSKANGAIYKANFSPQVS